VEALEIAIAEFKKIIASSIPNWNPSEALGMEFERNRSLRTISIRMSKRILELSSKHMNDYYRNRDISVPIPRTKFLVDGEEYEGKNSTLTAEEREYLNPAGQKIYLSIVGGVLWIYGIRWDIAIAIIFLTWFTKAPRVFHLDLAIRVIRYLECTIDCPLVLGGKGEQQLMTLTDASLATGPKKRSIIAYGSRLNPKAGFITAKVKATQYISLSSFECELNGHFEGFKQSKNLFNIAKELEFQLNPVRIIRNDNEKAVDFINSNADGKGVRHAELRFWYLREECAKGEIDFHWESGATIAVDSMTKCQDQVTQARFRADVQGLKLLEDE
jgi:hypothetical protein